MGARRAKEARLPNATGVTSTRKLQKVLTQAAAVYAILLVASGCGQKPLPLDNTGQTEPRVRSVFTETAEADDTTLIVTEPSTVTVIGVEDVGLGETISIEELIAESAELGQNVEAQLDSVLEEVPTDELDQVEAIDGDGFAAVSGDVQVLASAAVLSDPSGSRARPAGVYDRTSIWYDNKSKQMALRIGSSTWGWVHIQKHSVSLAMIQKTTKFPKTESVKAGETDSVRRSV